MRKLWLLLAMLFPLLAYAVPGPPSLLWLGPDGEERRQGRITGEVDAKGFLEQWQITRERG